MAVIRSPLFELWLGGIPRMLYPYFLKVFLSSTPVSSKNMNMSGAYNECFFFLFQLLSHLLFLSLSCLLFSLQLPFFPHFLTSASACFLSFISCRTVASVTSLALSLIAFFLRPVLDGRGWGSTSNSLRTSSELDNDLRDGVVIRLADAETEEVTLAEVA